MEPFQDHPVMTIRGIRLEPTGPGVSKCSYNLGAEILSRLPSVAPVSKGCHRGYNFLTLPPRVRINPPR